MPESPPDPQLAYKGSAVTKTTLLTSEQWRPSFTLAPGADRVGSMRGVAAGLQGQNFGLGLVLIPPGQQSPPHYYTGEHLFLQLRGATRFIVDDEEFIMRPMDSLFVPADVVYRYGSVGLEESLFVNVIGRTDEWPAISHYPGFNQQS